MLIKRGDIIIDGKFEPTRQEQRLAIIGHRTCSQVEKDMAYKLGYKMVQKGYWVVSGLALGIDASSMSGAIQACMDGYKGGVIGIVPTIYPNVYPKTNKHLYDLTKQYGYVIYAYKDAVLNNPKYAKKAKNSGDYFDVRPLLTDRSILNGELCHQVHIICDANIITGGSRYAIQKAINLGREVYHWKSNGKYSSQVKLQGNVKTEDVIYDVKAIEEAINL